MWTPLAAMRVCLNAELRVPKNIAFVGFDDIPAARYGAIPLTTLRVDKQELGRTGVEMLVGGGAIHNNGDAVSRPAIGRAAMICNFRRCYELRQQACDVYIK